MRAYKPAVSRGSLLLVKIVSSEAAQKVAKFGSMYVSLEKAQEWIS